MELNLLGLSLYPYWWERPERATDGETQVQCGRMNQLMLLALNTKQSLHRIVIPELSGKYTMCFELKHTLGFGRTKRLS